MSLTENSMTMNTFYLGLLIATLMQASLLVAALTLKKKGSRLSNGLLSGIIALFSYYMLIKVLCGTDLILDYPHLAQTYRPLPFLIWPAFYFYLKSMIDPRFHFQIKDCMHLIPFTLYTFYLLPFFLASEEVKLQSVSIPLSGNYFFVVVLQTILLLFYIVQSYRILRSHQEHIQNLFSDIEKKKLSWLNFFLITFGIIWVAAFIKAFLGISYTGDFAIPPILLCLTIYGIGYYALQQPEIFKDNHTEIKPDEKLTILRSAATSSGAGQALNMKSTPKYEYSTLTSQELSKHGQKLIEYLKKEKPYTNSDLKLQDIALFLKLPPHQISQIINTELKCNFYTLINKYRIDQAKSQLIDSGKQHLNIIEIAYEVGFNSKSAFNTAFKKNTGLTPTQYKKQRLSRSAAA